MTMTSRELIATCLVAATAIIIVVGFISYRSGVAVGINANVERAIVSDRQSTEVMKLRLLGEALERPSRYPTATEIGRIFREQHTLSYLKEHFPACEIVNIAYGSHVQRRAGGAEMVYFLISSACPPDGR